MNNGRQIRRLALAAVLRGVKDAADGDTEAQDWLLTTGHQWLDLANVEVEPDKIQSIFGKTWKATRQEVIARRKQEKLNMKPKSNGGTKMTNTGKLKMPEELAAEVRQQLGNDQEAQGAYDEVVEGELSRAVGKTFSEINRDKYDRNQAELKKQMEAELSKTAGEQRIDVVFKYRNLGYGEEFDPSAAIDMANKDNRATMDKHFDNAVRRTVDRAKNEPAQKRLREEYVVAQQAAQGNLEALFALKGKYRERGLKI